MQTTPVPFWLMIVSVATAVFPVWRSPMINSRWPRPMGIIAWMAFSPGWSGSFTGCRLTMPGALISTRRKSFVPTGPRPSTGWPRALTTRPIIASPHGTSTMRPVRRTVSPSLIRWSSPRRATPTLSSSRLSTIPRTSPGNSRSSPAMAFSRPWTRGIPSPPERTRPGSAPPDRVPFPRPALQPPFQQVLLRGGHRRGDGDLDPLDPLELLHHAPELPEDRQEHVHPALVDQQGKERFRGGEKAGPGEDRIQGGLLVRAVDVPCLQHLAQPRGRVEDPGELLDLGENPADLPVLPPDVPQRAGVPPGEASADHWRISSIFSRFSRTSRSWSSGDRVLRTSSSAARAARRDASRRSSSRAFFTSCSPGNSACARIREISTAAVSCRRRDSAPASASIFAFIREISSASFAVRLSMEDNFPAASARAFAASSIALRSSSLGSARKEESGLRRKYTSTPARTAKLIACWSPPPRGPPPPGCPPPPPAANARAAVHKDGARGATARNA